MEKEITNNRKGKVLFKMFVTPEELEFLLTNQDPICHKKVFDLIMERGDVI